MKSKHVKQSEATKYIKDLLASRGIEVNPGIVLIGEDQPWQVFEYNNRCIAVDLNAGVWIGVKGGKWDCIATPCTVSGALEALEFLIESKLSGKK